MAISDTQKLDALYKKFGFGVAKTDTASNKSPSNEAIASPLLVRGDKVWNESDLIPATPPSATTAKVKVRTDAGDGAVEATADATATPNRTWITNVTNWIPVQFGATYAVKVYADAVGATNPQTTGTLLSPDGSGNNDAYLFDYESGVLNFSDTNIPSAVTGKKIYVVGYTYSGSIGLKNSSGIGGGLTSTNGSITTTTTNGDLTLSGNGTGDVVLNSDTQVNGTLTSTGTITAPTISGNVTSTGTSSFNNITVSGSTSVNTLTATGNSSLEDVTVSGTLSVTGATTLADVTAEDGTFATITVTGTSTLQGATTVGTVGTNADLTVNGNIVATGTATVDGNVTINGKLTVSGSQTVIETEVLKVADNIITLNNGIGAKTSPTESAGLEVDRGTEGLRTIIQWNETTDVVEVWQGTQLREVATKADLTSASGDLTAELNATQASAGINTDGTFTAFAGTYTKDTTLKAGIVTLDTNLARVETGVGVWGNLTTTSKVVVGAINELDAELGNTALTTAATTITASINEVDLHANNIYSALGVTTDASTVGFSGLNFVPSNSTIKSAIEALDTQLNSISNRVDGNIGTLGDLTTTSKTTLVSAINEVDLHANSIYGVMGVTADATVSGFKGLNYVGNDATLKAAITTLDTQLKTTTDQVDGKIGTLADLTTTTKVTLVAAINEVDTDLATEVSRAQAAEITIANAIAAEVTSRTNADNALTTRINNVNTAAGITTDTYTANGTATYIKTATSLVSADNLLDTALKTTVDNLASTTAGQGTGLVGYKGYIESDVNIINPAIEIAAGTLEAALTDIASSVNLKIHELENRYVKGEVDADDASDTYTIAHNLDTNFVDVSVQVYDTDLSVWRFDLVVVEVIDVNTVKISLASGVSAQIRYVIHGY